ncbi:ribonuclease III [Ramaria rubella]|nr:ribonuclease III [Ramaria rubella]
MNRTMNKLKMHARLAEFITMSENESQLGLPRKPSLLTHCPSVTMISSALDPAIKPEDLPDLPRITSEDINLQVYTHRSVFARPTHVFEDAPGDPAPDNETLEHLGDSVLGLCVTSLIREMYPCLRVGPATKIRAIVVGNPTLASISTHYKLPEALRLHQAQAITLRASTNIQADVFQSYIAGVYVTQGLGVVQTWLYSLLRPYVALAYRIIRAEYGFPPEPLPSSPPPSEPIPTESVKPLPAPSPRPPPTFTTSSRGVTTGHLSLFNQHLQQKGLYVEWDWADSDVSSRKATPVWAVRAMVDQQCLGKGMSTTKKAAKNEAATQALQSLGVIV